MAALSAGTVIFGSNSFSGNSSSSLSQKSRILSNVLLRRGATWPSNLQASSSSSSSSRATRSETSSGCDGATEQEKNPKFVSRRWATIALPAAVAALTSSIAFSNGKAMAETVAIEKEDVEDATGLRVEGDVAIEGSDLRNSGFRVVLRTLSGCGLGVARYPDFVYNAEGGGGTGKAQQLADGRTHVQFDAEGLYIPAVFFDTTTILGLPLPPGLKIEVVPKTLEGYVEQSTGKVELNFLANFYFTAGSLYRAPPLVVDTKLTTESAQGEFRRGTGQRLDSSGNVKLVGVARLAPVNDLFLSTFLTLPTDCLAELSANLSFS